MLTMMKRVFLAILAVLFVLFALFSMGDGAILAGIIFIAALFPIYKLWSGTGKKRFMLPALVASFVIGMTLVGSTTETEEVVEAQPETASVEAEATPEPKLTEAEQKEADAEAKRIAEEEAKAEAERLAKEEEEQKKRDAEEAKEKEAAFANSTIEFKHLSKGADRYADEAVRFTGEIVQIQEDGDEGTTIRLAVTQTSYGWDSNDIVMLYYPELTEFFTEDVITVDGYIVGDHTYTSQAGWDITVPLIRAEKLY